MFTEDKKETKYIRILWPDTQQYRQYKWFNQEAYISEDDEGTEIYFVPENRFYEHFRSQFVENLDLEYNIPIKEFIKSCEVGIYSDDGFGYPIVNTIEDTTVKIDETNLNQIPKGTTHIRWYAK